MKASGRTEWNTMPGYTRAERHQANHPNEEAAFNALEVGLDAATLSEFLRAPTLAIAERIVKKTSDLRGDVPQVMSQLASSDDNDLLTLVLRLAPVLILAERERAEKEEERKHG